MSWFPSPSLRLVLVSLSSLHVLYWLYGEPGSENPGTHRHGRRAQGRGPAHRLRGEARPGPAPLWHLDPQARRDDEPGVAEARPRRAVLRHAHGHIRLLRLARGAPHPSPPARI